MPRKRVAVTVGELELLVQSVTSETIAETPYIAPAHEELREILEETRQLMKERDQYTALKQEATRRIQEKLEAGCRAATILRHSLRYRYGNRPEPLAAFRIKPAHGRPRGRKTAKAQPDSPRIRAGARRRRRDPRRGDGKRRERDSPSVFCAVPSIGGAS